MLAELKLQLEVIGEGEVGVYQASNFHGALMELISREYAEKIHLSELHPYSQSIFVKENKVTWNIKTLNEEAYNNIIIPLLNPQLDTIEIKKKNVLLKITNRVLQTKTKRQLLDDFYDKESEEYYDITFLSPTSFKRDGKYLNMPDISLIYRSLMKKYSVSSDDTNMLDYDTIDALTESSEILQYQLKSTYFRLEGVKIPSFMGRVVIKVKGNKTLSNYARMLFEFGEYSGVGIKTSIGMGAISLNRRKTYNE